MARKCAKCGVTSDEDSALSFHRFPQPSVHGSLKAKVWAMFCFPNGDWTSDQSLMTLNKQHKMLCSHHFHNSSFTSNDRKRLNKFAIPTEACNILAELHKELQSSETQRVKSEEKMKEERRKCVKCGASPADDPETALFRFPKPGSSNILRSELWSKYVYPDKPYWETEFQMKGYTDHRMLCHRHFKETAFIDYPSKKLHRYAHPEIEMETMFFEQDDEVAYMDSPSQSQSLPDVSSLIDLSSDVPEFSGINITIPFTSKRKLKPSVFNVERNSKTYVNVSQPFGADTVVPEASSTRIDIPEAPSRLDPTVLERNFETSDFGINKVSETFETEVPKASNCRKHLQRIRNLKRRIKFLENKAFLEKLTTNDAIEKLVTKISEEFRRRPLKRRVINSKVRRWTQDDKIRALRLYKKSPSYYKLMRQMFDLPSPSVVLDFVLKRQVKC